MKILQFLPVFPALKLTQNYYINMNIFSPCWNRKLNHNLGTHFSFTNILCLKDYPHNLTEYEIKGTSKITISQLFSKLGKTWICSLGLYSKNLVFHLFYMHWEKMRSPDRATFKKPKNLFVNLEKD